MINKKIWATQHDINANLIEQIEILDDMVSKLTEKVNALITSHHNPSMFNAVLKHDTKS